MAVVTGDLNGSTQSLSQTVRDGVCGDQTKISSRVHCGREDGAVGSLAAGESLKADHSGDDADQGRQPS
jgi:hypothetical protein